MSAVPPTGVSTPTSLTPDQLAQKTFNQKSLYYLRTLKELQNLESDPFHDRAQAEILKGRVDSLYVELEAIAEDNPHLSLELPSMERPPQKAVIQTLSIEEWQRTRPEEYATFTRFDHAKRKYIDDADSLEHLQKLLKHCTKTASGETRRSQR